MLIPIGLLLGGAVRSMLPVWIFTGRPIVPRDARIWIQVSGAALMIAWMTVLSRRGAIPALALRGRIPGGTHDAIDDGGPILIDGEQRIGLCLRVHGCGERQCR